MCDLIPTIAQIEILQQTLYYYKPLKVNICQALINIITHYTWISFQWKHPVAIPKHLYHLYHSKYLKYQTFIWYDHIHQYLGITYYIIYVHPHLYFNNPPLKVSSQSSHI